MFWKILFIFCALVLTYLQFGGLANFMTLAEVNILLGYILSAIIVFILGYFFSLGWNKRLFFFFSNNIIFSLIVLYMIFSMVMAVISGITPIVFEIKRQTAGTVSDSSIYLSTIMLLGLSAFVLYSLLYSPVIVAFFKYKRRFENLQPLLENVSYIFVGIQCNFYNLCTYYGGFSNFKLVGYPANHFNDL